MSSELDMLNAQQHNDLSTETTTVQTDARRNSKRQSQRLRVNAGNSRSSGILGVFGERFNRNKTHDYTALSQGDVELAADASVEHSNDAQQPGSGSESNSSSVEDLFVNRSRRKVRRKMVRRGIYSMRNTFMRRRSFFQEGQCTPTIAISMTILTIVLLGFCIFIVIYGHNREVVVPPEPDYGIHLDDILSGKMLGGLFNGTWSGKETIMMRNRNGILEVNVRTTTWTMLLRDVNNTYTLFEKSADGKYLLLAKNVIKNFRHSFQAKYDIYEIATKQMKSLNISGVPVSVNLAQWAPVGNGLIINYERNLYYKPKAYTASEVIITTDLNGAILNGIPDWVYEEEVLSDKSATWFNKNGSKIAFIKFDDSPTHTMILPYYGEAGDPNFQYPFNRAVPYPKSGSSNPRVKLFTADLVRAAQYQEFLTEVPVPSGLNTQTDYLITAVTWLNNNVLLSVWMNRIQNVAYVQTFDGLRRHLIHTFKSQDGWVDLFGPLFKSGNGSYIAVIVPQSQRGLFYRHLCIISTIVADVKIALTKGKFVVQSILHWDPKEEMIYFTANTEQNSAARHVYAVRAFTTQKAKCISCNLVIYHLTEQTYFSAEFGPGKYVVMTSDGPGVPNNAVYSIFPLNYGAVLRFEMDWEDNNDLRFKLADMSLPTVEMHDIPITGDLKARVHMQLPPNMDRSGKTKYPMLVDVYGGPDSYSVVDRRAMDWGTYLSSNHSVIYVKIDGRGSGLLGDKMLYALYLNFGTVEITDQIEVTRKLQKQFSFIDANRTGIWGWSYGGYAAAMALAKDNSSVFRCAASIAPVTDWSYYDSIYTERYMRLPKTNAKGYNNSRLTTRAEGLRGKKFLLVHGTMDDNVHYQQSMILAKNLEQRDILFKQISYTDEDHALAGVRPHLYHSLDRFFGDCFEIERMMRSGEEDKK